MTINTRCPKCGSDADRAGLGIVECPKCRKRYRSDGSVIPSYSEELAAKNREPARTCEAIDFEAEKAAKLAKTDAQTGTSL
jgi:ribosomal protein L37AE/L43A